MAYFVNWAGMDPSVVPAASLTHVFYAFAAIDASTYQYSVPSLSHFTGRPSNPAVDVTQGLYLFNSALKALSPYSFETPHLLSPSHTGRPFQPSSGRDSGPLSFQLRPEGPQPVVLSSPAVDVTQGLNLRSHSAFKAANPYSSQTPHLLSPHSSSSQVVPSNPAVDVTEAFVNAASSPSSRSAFIQSAIALARSYNFDGLDIDWEYPTGNAALFSALLTDFRAAIESEAASSGNPQLLLSAAVSAYEPTIAESYDVPTLNSALDFVNVMTYDLHGSWELITGMHTALEDLSNPQLSLKGAMAAWVSRGLAPSKAMLGLAMYGRTWTLASASSTGVGAAATGPGQPGSISQCSPPPFTGPPPPASGSPTPSTGLKRMAYFGSWGSRAAIPAAKLTHVFYAFASINPTTYKVVSSNATVEVDGGLYKLFNTDLKRANPAVKTLLSIGGATAGTTVFSNSASSTATRSAFIQSAIALARAHNFDGLDLDWEFPSGKAASFSALLTDFRAAIESEAASSKKPKLLLTAAVAPDEKRIAESYNVPMLNKNAGLNQYYDVRFPRAFVGENDWHAHCSGG
ncbi:unnamed protein product [Closterium sp. Naga37s-1]|nr:unnamed protein product [Closterium sp. Naga37s-1]